MGRPRSATRGIAASLPVVAALLAWGCSPVRSPPAPAPVPSVPTTLTVPPVAPSAPVAPSETWSTPPRLEDEAFLAGMARSVVCIELLDEGNRPLGSASAFFVGRNRLATCWHVVEPATAARIRFASGEEFPVVGLLWKDTESDLALLAVETPGVEQRPLVLQSGPPKTGDRLVVVGPPGPGDPSCIASYGRALPNPPGELPIAGGFRFRMPLAPGWSGSPVLSAEGEVLGVAGAGFAWTSFSVAAPTAPLREASTKTGSLLPRSLSESATRGPFGRKKSTQQRDERYPAHLLPAVSANARGDPGEAEVLIRAVVARSPADADAWGFLAGLLHEKGQARDAIGALRKACEARPGDAALRCAVGSALIEAKLFGDAVGEFKEAIRLDAKDPDSHYSLGFCLSSVGKYEEAIAVYKEVLQIDPSYKAAQQGIDYARAMIAARR